MIQPIEQALKQRSELTGIFHVCQTDSNEKSKRHKGTFSTQASRFTSQWATAATVCLEPGMASDEFSLRPVGLELLTGTPWGSMVGPMGPWHVGSLKGPMGTLHEEPMGGGDGQSIKTTIIQFKFIRLDASILMC